MRTDCEVVTLSTRSTLCQRRRRQRDSHAERVQTEISVERQIGAYGVYRPLETSHVALNELIVLLTAATLLLSNLTLGSKAAFASTFTLRGSTFLATGAGWFLRVP